MNIRRFVGASTRDAMLQLKAELGEDALILTNRRTEQGIEILATLDPKFDQLTRKASTSRPTDATPPKSTVSARKSNIGKPVEAKNSAMSTVSFQDYVRERLAQPQSSAKEPLVDTPLPISSTLHSDNHNEQTQNVAPRLAGVKTFEKSLNERQALTDSDQALLGADRPSSLTKPGEVPQLLAELREVKAMLGRQVDSATWLGGGSARSARARRSHKLLDAGLSPGLVRYLVEHMPEDLSLEQEHPWLEKALARNCKKSSIIPELLNDGGMCALVGPTGVGKTTTIAKLAARAVLHRGAACVALVTLDNFRVGAFEQLSVYGRLLGVSVHQAKDRTSLALLLAQLQDKKTVLIDTVGVSTQDDKLQELLHSLELPRVKKIFVASAAAQGDTIDRALKAHRVEKGNPIILTKLDEIERLGPAIDCMLRHGLSIAGLTNGQRVPEDWHAPDPHYLAREALRCPEDERWQLDEQLAITRLQNSKNIEKWTYAKS
jgi:flagellar biosynthesis protein FlhF